MTERYVWLTPELEKAATELAVAGGYDLAAVLSAVELLVDGSYHLNEVQKQLLDIDKALKEIREIINPLRSGYNIFELLATKILFVDICLTIIQTHTFFSKDRQDNDENRT